MCSWLYCQFAGGCTEPLRVADVVAVASRLPGAGAGLWNKVKSACSHELALYDCCVQSSQDAGRKLLKRVEFEEVMLEQRTSNWPVDATGSAVGGETLRATLGGQIAARKLTDTAVDAFWVAFSGGSPYVAKEEVERQLSRWRPTSSEFDLAAFELSVIQGRMTVFLGYMILFGIEGLALAILVVKPILEAIGMRN